MKRIYLKPQIKCIKLMPQEAVLTVCKVSSGSNAQKCNCSNTRNLGS